ncbi:DUF2793 domain-containing protein [Stappia stellulata]|uniref:DUF2793 domain-containing protein n=1 Tax=Stappia stellulata TaxID=71235 RepID=UPI00040F60E2|nr:DUF2793 domain-containing protein [Stappia stellulata]
MADTPHLALPLMEGSQGQKHVTHNEALIALDALVQLVVESRGLAQAPPSPMAEDRYIVSSGATGVWAGKDGQVAVYKAEGWLYHMPRPGWSAVLKDEMQIVLWSGTDWLDLRALPIEFAQKFGVNASVSDYERFAVSSPSSLFNHQGDSHRLKINKMGPGDTASIVFQTGYSGLAEMGLAGSNSFQLKVSADGVTFLNAMSVDGAGGDVDFSLANGGGVQIGRYTIGASPRLYLNADATDGARALIVLAHNHQQRAAIYTETDSSAGIDDLYVCSYQDDARIRLVTSHDGATQWNHLVLDGETGSVGIGKSDPSATLDVDGPVRVKSFTVANLPGATAVGAGALVHVLDDAGGSVLAFSDGSDWRRATDRSVVST